MSGSIHFNMLTLAKEAFEVEGFKTYVTENKSPDIIICDNTGKLYAVEVLTKPSLDSVHSKIEKYMAEDIDGIYFIIPQHNVNLINKFANRKVSFISVPELLTNSVAVKREDEKSTYPTSTHISQVKERDKLSTTFSLILRMEKLSEIVKKRKFLKRLKSEYKINNSEAERLIGKLLKLGLIYLPKDGYLKTNL